MLSEQIDYLEKYPSFSELVPQFRKLLKDSGEKAYFRCHLPGHLTGSAFVFTEDRAQLLLLHHRKLDKWLQPGGHADGEYDLEEVALRECTEETGVGAGLCRYRIPGVPFSVPIDLDIHRIPKNPKEGEHFHFDVRYLFFSPVAVPIQRNDESKDVRWFSISDARQIITEASMLRVIDRVLAL